MKSKAFWMIFYDHFLRLSMYTWDTCVYKIGCLYDAVYTQTITSDDKIGTTSLSLDPKHGLVPQSLARLSAKEKHGVPAGYLHPVLEKAPQIKPVSVAFFGGKLDYSKLSLPGWLFVKLLIRGKDGDYRICDAICDWSVSLKDTLLQ